MTVHLTQSAGYGFNKYQYGDNDPTIATGLDWNQDAKDGLLQLALGEMSAGAFNAAASYAAFTAACSLGGNNYLCIGALVPVASTVSSITFGSGAYTINVASGLNFVNGMAMTATDGTNAITGTIAGGGGGSALVLSTSGVTTSGTPTAMTAGSPIKGSWPPPNAAYWLLAGPSAAGTLIWCGTWSSSTAYIPGDVVLLSGTAYACIASNTNTTPPNSTYWTVLTVSVTQTGINWRGPWSASNSYAVGDAVGLNGTAYVAVAANINSTPPNSSWNVLAGSGATGAAGSTGAAGANGISDVVALNSTSSVTIGAGSQTFAFASQSNLGWAVGTRLRAAYPTTPTNYMEGLVTAVSAISVTINVDTVGGAGTFTSWNIGIAGQPGSGNGNVNGPASSTVGHLATFGNTAGTQLADGGAPPTTANAKRWVALVAGTDFTAVPASTSTITMITNQTANIQPGMALQFVVGGSTYYCQCIAITSSLLTVRGTTLGSSALTSLAYDSMRQTAQYTLFIGTAWTSTGVSLAAALGQYLGLGLNKSHLIGWRGTLGVKDTGAAQPYVQPYLNGALVCNSTQMSATPGTFVDGGVWTGDVSLTYGQALDVQCPTLGTNKTANQLNLELVFVQE